MIATNHLLIIYDLPDTVLSQEVGAITTSALQVRKVSHKQVRLRVTHRAVLPLSHPGLLQTALGVCLPSTPSAWAYLTSFQLCQGGAELPCPGPWRAQPHGSGHLGCASPAPFWGTAHQARLPRAPHALPPTSPLHLLPDPTSHPKDRAPHSCSLQALRSPI